MARYGDLDSVKLKVQRYLIPNTDIDGTVTCADAERWFLKLLDEEPTADVVEVVRCKDCVRGSLDSEGNISCSYFMCDGLPSDGYCSCGERRE